MPSLNVHVVHMGHMANRGTQALLTCDVHVIRKIIKNSAISVSTTDVKGVRQVGLGLKAVLPPLIDIPYERADLYAKRISCTRESYRYKAFALASLLLMLVQIALTTFSTILVRLGLKALYRPEVFKHIRESEIIVSCSDENFKETASLLPLNVYWIAAWWTMLLSRTWEILVAKFLDKPVVMFPNSVGPFRTLVGVLLSKLALNRCNWILIREPISLNVVRCLGIRSPTVLTSDTGLLLGSNSKIADSLLTQTHPTMVICAGIYSNSLPKHRVFQYISAHTKALDTAIDQLGVNVTFLPHYISGFKSDDLETSRLILSEMKNKAAARIVQVRTAKEFKAILNEAELVVSSKMHPAVLAVSSFVPTLCLAYDHKQTGFFRNLGLNDCLVPLHELSESRLISQINHVWNKRDEIKQILKTRIPELQRHIMKSMEQAFNSIMSEKELDTRTTLIEVNHA